MKSFRQFDMTPVYAGGIIRSNATPTYGHQPTVAKPVAMASSIYLAYLMACRPYYA